MVSFQIERSLTEMENPKAKDNLLSSLEHLVSEIQEGLNYVNNDVELFNRRLKNQAALRAFNGMRNVTAVDKNEYECLFLSEANPGQQVKKRVMLFNLYSD